MLETAGKLPTTLENRDPVLEQLRVKAFRTSMQSTSAFWKLVSIHFLGCVSHAIVIIYIIPIAVLAGMEEVAAAGVLSTLALVSVSTRFLTPVISDYIGSRGTMATAFVWQGLPVLMLFWAHDPWQFYLFAVIFGIGYGGEGSAFPVIRTGVSVHTLPQCDIEHHLPGDGPESIARDPSGASGPGCIAGCGYNAPPG